MPFKYTTSPLLNILLLEERISHIFSTISTALLQSVT